MKERPQGVAVGKVRWLGRMVLVAAGVAALSGCVTEVVSVPVEVPVEVPDCDVPNLRSDGSYRVEAWAVPDSRFDVGEPLALQVRVSAPSYVTLFHVSTSCKVTRLLDNRKMPMREVVDFPTKGSGMRVTVKPPGGREGFYFIATLDRLAFLASGDILQESNEVAAIDMTPAEFYRRVEQARARMNPADWTLTTLRTTVTQH